MEIHHDPSPRKKFFTPEQYPELEIEAEERYEYIGGEIILMPGGMPNHNRIALNLAATLIFGLKRQP